VNPFIQDVVAEAISRQSFFQKNANTIVSGLSALAAVLTFLVSIQIGLPPLVTAGIVAAIPVINTLVKKLATKGFQPSMVAKLSETDAAPRPVNQGASLMAAEIARVRGQLEDYVGKHRNE